MGAFSFGKKISILEAAEIGDMKTVMKKLKREDNLKMRDSNGDTALHCACRNNQIRVAKVLLEAEADANEKSQDGSTALHYAAHKGFDGMAILLLDFKANARSLTKWGETPLHYAVKHGNVGVATVLLEFGADPNDRDNRGWTSMHFVTQTGKLGCVRLLLDHGADMFAKTNNGDTPLGQARKNHHEELVALLEKEAADIELRGIRETGLLQTITELKVENEKLTDVIKNQRDAREARTKAIVASKREHLREIDRLKFIINNYGRMLAEHGCNASVRVTALEGPVSCAHTSDVSDTELAEFKNLPLERRLSRRSTRSSVSSKTDLSVDRAMAVNQDSAPSSQADLGLTW